MKLLSATDHAMILTVAKGLDRDGELAVNIEDFRLSREAVVYLSKQQVEALHAHLTAVLTTRGKK